MRGGLHLCARRVLLATQGQIERVRPSLVGALFHRGGECTVTAIPRRERRHCDWPVTPLVQHITLYRTGEGTIYLRPNSYMQISPNARPEEELGPR